MQIHKSAEDYLETILILQLRKGNVRSIDVANELGFSKPSVSVAMKNFRENGYIIMDADNFITLTDAGREVAEHVYERHVVLTGLLSEIGVSEENASRDACLMEHDISDETFEKIKIHYQKLVDERVNAEKKKT